MQNKIFPLTAGKNGKGKLFRWVVILIGLFLHWQMDVANKGQWIIFSQYSLKFFTGQ